MTKLESTINALNNVAIASAKLDAENFVSMLKDSFFELTGIRIVIISGEKSKRVESDTRVRIPIFNELVLYAELPNGYNKSESITRILLKQFVAIIVQPLSQMYFRREIENTSDISIRDLVALLSYSERTAMIGLFPDLLKLDGDKHIVVSSKVADAVGVSRSVVVNMFRKLESANIIRTTSLGAKGTLVNMIRRHELEEVVAGL